MPPWQGWNSDDPVQQGIELHGLVHWGGVSVGGGNAGVHLRKVDKVVSSFIGHFMEELQPITEQVAALGVPTQCGTRNYDTRL
jgi:hypothetical protein